MKSVLVLIIKVINYYYNEIYDTFNYKFQFFRLYDLYIKIKKLKIHLLESAIEKLLLTINMSTLEALPIDVICLINQNLNKPTDSLNFLEVLEELFSEDGYIHKEIYRMLIDWINISAKYYLPGGFVSASYGFNGKRNLFELLDIHTIIFINSRFIKISDSINFLIAIEPYFRNNNYTHHIVYNYFKRIIYELLNQKTYIPSICEHCEKFKKSYDCSDCNKTLCKDCYKTFYKQKNNICGTCFNKYCERNCLFCIYCNKCLYQEKMKECIRCSVKKCLGCSDEQSRGCLRNRFHYFNK